MIDDKTELQPTTVSSSMFITIRQVSLALSRTQYSTPT